MTRTLRLIGLAAALCSSQDLLARSPSDCKVKVKDGRLVAREKTKPVRRAIEDWYVSNVEAFKAVHTRADMEAYTERFLGRIDHFVSLEFEIGTIEANGDLASADVTQDTVRMQRFPDGSLHKVEAGAVQRETWRRTPQGWKMCRVDNIRDTIGVLVDDKPYNPNP